MTKYVQNPAPNRSYCPSCCFCCTTVQLDEVEGIPDFLYEPGIHSIHGCWPRTRYWVERRAIQIDGILRYCCCGCCIPKGDPTPWDWFKGKMAWIAGHVCCLGSKTGWGESPYASF